MTNQPKLAYLVKSPTSNRTAHIVGAIKAVWCLVLSKDGHHFPLRSSRQRFSIESAPGIFNTKRTDISHHVRKITPEQSAILEAYDRRIASMASKLRVIQQARDIAIEDFFDQGRSVFLEDILPLIVACRALRYTFV